jgi:hypothetical protein
MKSIYTKLKIIFFNKNELKFIINNRNPKKYLFDKKKKTIIFAMPMDYFFFIILEIINKRKFFKNV